MNERARALVGEDVAVDVASIERSLAELWRSEGTSSDDGVTKAALWNVVAHTTEESQKALASSVLGRVSASVPQRTMIIRSVREDETHISSWISANCHLLGHGKQVCSEEIMITAGGDRVDYVPPLVHALLMPELPVATWWLGDLPLEEKSYLAALLDPVDHLIVDSCDFSDVSDLAFLAECGEMTNTIPSDINWFRMEEWRSATASLFDCSDILARSLKISRVEIGYGGQSEPFGDRIEALLYAAWLLSRLRYGRESGGFEGAAGRVELQLRREREEPGQLASVKITFDDGAQLQLLQDDAARAIRGHLVNTEFARQIVTPVASRELEKIVVRQLSRTGADHVYADVLPIAIDLAKELRA